MSTVQNIIDGALGWSTLNDQDILASDTELINLIDLLQKRYFSRAAAVNPAYFGSRTTVVAPGLAGSPWTAPATASIVFRIEKVNGTKVHIVPLDDQNAAYAPSVFELGQAFYSTGADPDPTTESLNFYFSAIPTTLTAVVDSLDSLWPEHFDGILELEVAKYLSLKDGREGEAAALDTILTSQLDAFDTEVGSFNAAREGRFAV